jgi:hypothetical protein
MNKTENVVCTSGSSARQWSTFDSKRMPTTTTRQGTKNSAGGYRLAAAGSYTLRPPGLVLSACGTQKEAAWYGVVTTTALR